MGQHADDALNEIWDWAEDYHNAKDKDAWIEENGPPPFGYGRGAWGPGSCPQCGGATKLKNGKHGRFYGCLKFPNCKGSRQV